MADLLAIPEERRRHELIDGVIVEKEAASGRHGGAQSRLVRWVGPYDRRPGGRFPGGWWFATEVEIELGEIHVFRPDVAGWRREHLDTLPSEVPIRVRPDWVCEILTVHRWHPDGYVEVLVAERSDIVRAEPFEAIDLRVGVLFGDDED